MTREEFIAEFRIAFLGLIFDAVLNRDNRQYTMWHDMMSARVVAELGKAYDATQQEQDAPAPALSNIEVYRAFHGVDTPTAAVPKPQPQANGKPQVTGGPK